MIILGSQLLPRRFISRIVRDGCTRGSGRGGRFRRIKHGQGFWRRRLAYCLAEAGISLADVDHVTVNQDSRANLGGKLRYVLSQRPDPRLLWSRWRIRGRAARLNTCKKQRSTTEIYGGNTNASRRQFLFGSRYDENVVARGRNLGVTNVTVQK